MDLIIAGAVLLGVGYLAPAVTDTILGQMYSCCLSLTRPYAPNWGFGLIPLLHPVAALNAQSGTDTLILTVGLAGAAMEIAGVVLLVLGVVGHERSPGVSMGPGRLIVGGSDGGASMSYTLRF